MGNNEPDYVVKFLRIEYVLNEIEMVTYHDEK